MALSARLQVRQSQSLVITPQLMQAIRLLQMPVLELERFIESEIEQNPLLEREDAGRHDDDVKGAAEAGTIEQDEGLDGAAAELDAEPTDVFPEAFGSDAGWNIPSTSRASSPSGWEDLDIGQSHAAGESLAELLELRIHNAFANMPADRLIALSLLAGLDESGYLTLPLDVVTEKLAALPFHVERVLRRCQEIAPTGIFARNLAECLALQLAERNRLDPAMQILLANLDRLASRDYAALSVRCGVDRADLDDMIAEIRALDPKPGLAFSREPVRVVFPDVFVRQASDGGWMLELNDAVLPRLIVNRSYVAKVTGKCRQEDKRYLSDCLQKATWLERSLDQRAKTVLRVATEIVRRQTGFLAEGVTHLRPLNLRMVADALGIHESTVSRAVANKTMATPRGIFEFRYFFNAALAATAGGEAHSSEAVRHLIRRLIIEESADVVYSDDAIAALLSRQGIEIARRTVAKYRELMRIGSSVDRRRQKRLRVAS
jgi:RNA polymerase sigma-54 factor